MRDGETGRLAERVEPDALAAAIRSLLEGGERMRDACRARAERDHSIDVQARRLLELVP